MIMPSDQDYQQTKLIKQGHKKINPQFKLLADWINSRFKVSVLNVFYDKLKADKNRPRLTIIFEFQQEELKFRNGHLGNFDSLKQRIIAEKFTSKFVVSK